MILMVNGDPSSGQAMRGVQLALAGKQSQTGYLLVLLALPLLQEHPVKFQMLELLVTPHSAVHTDSLSFLILSRHFS